MTTSGALMVGVKTASQPEMSWEDDTGAASNYVATTFVFPAVILVIQGDVAYEFKYQHPTYQTFSGYHPATGYFDHDRKNARFFLNRILNRFGDVIEFAYRQTNGLSAYTATWKPGGVANGTSIDVAFTSATSVKVTYGGLPANNLSFTITLTDLYALPGIGAVERVGLDKNDGWQNLGVSSVTQDFSGEQVAFSYVPGPTLTYGSPSTLSVAPPIIKTVTFPGRTLTFGWNIYTYVRSTSYGDEAAACGGFYPSNLPSWAWGVTSVSEDGGGQIRATAHTRAVPIPVEDPSWPGTFLVGTFSPSAFYDLVTHPDGSRSLSRFQDPSQAGATPLGWMLFAKHLALEDRRYKADDDAYSDINTPAETSIAYARIRRSNWVLNSVGNPDGTGCGTPVPMPKTVETWQNSEGVLVYRREEMSDWDLTNFGWKTSTVTLKVNGATQSVRVASRTYQSDPVNWFFGRKLRNQIVPTSDATGSLAQAVVLPKSLPPEIQAFDPTTNVVTSSQIGEDSDAKVVTSFTFGTSGLSKVLPQSVSVTGPWLQSGQVGIQTYEYDASGYLSQILQKGAPWPLANAPSQESDVFGRPTSQTDPNKIKVSYEYDAAGRLNKISRPGEEAVQIQYDDSTHKGVKVIQGSSTVEYRYNGFGEVVLERRFNGTVYSNRMTSYDPMGRKTLETIWGAGLGDETKWAQSNLMTLYPTGQANSQGGAAYSYDLRGRLTQVVNPNLEKVTTTYNGLTTTKTMWGRVNGATAPTALATIFTKDGLGRLVKVEDPKGQATTYKYDEADRILEVHQKDSVTNVEQVRYWAYDALGHVVVLDQPESGVTYYTGFTVTGKPTITVYGLASGWRPAASFLNSTDPSAFTATGVKVVRSTPDLLGRMQSIVSDDGTVNQGFTYDQGGAPALAYGKLTSDSDGGANGVQRVYGYLNGLNGRLSSLETTVLGQPALTQTFSYDSMGRRTGASTPQGVFATNYDPATGLPTAASRTAGNVQQGVVNSVSYDSVSWNPLSMGFGNGASSIFTYRADQSGLASLSHYESGGGSAWGTWGYTYDEGGQLLSDGEDSYQYDELGRLTKVIAKRLNATTWKPDGTQIVTQTFGYDAFGNQTSSLAVGALPGSTGPNYNFNNFTFSGSELTTMAATNRLPGTAGGIPTGAQYDVQGNLVRMYQQTSSVVAPALWVDYDALGRVVRIKDEKRNITETYQYSADNLRVVVNSYDGVGLNPPLLKATINLYNDQRQLVSQYEWILE